MTNFAEINVFGNTSLSDLFKQIHRNNKDTDKQINELIDALKPLASSNAGSAVMLMPTVKDLIDVDNDGDLDIVFNCEKNLNTTDGVMYNFGGDGTANFNNSATINFDQLLYINNNGVIIHTK